MPVDKITSTDTVAALEPIWLIKRETAERVMNRLAKILDAAEAAGHRSGTNPASWRFRLQHLLTKPKAQHVKHDTAVPYADVPRVMTKLRKLTSVSARAVEFAVLTAARTGEAIAARWSEFDFDKRLWTVPAVRMKAGREHVVPLSDRVVELLQGLPQNEELVFPGKRRDHGLSNMALLQCVRGVAPGCTTHGFRSSFRDWAAECTNYPDSVVEIALAHTIPSKTERAYRRGALLEKRRALMAEWAIFCSVYGHLLVPICDRFDGHIWACCARGSAWNSTWDFRSLFRHCARPGP